MTHTNEFLAAMFCAYWGGDVVISHWQSDNDSSGPYPISAINANSLCVGKNKNGIDMWFKLNECKPILTPLSAITDADAVEVAKMAMWHYDKEFDGSDEVIADNIELNEFGIHIDVSCRCFEGYVSIHDGLVFISDHDTELEQLSYGVVRITDFLRSKGYDCGFRSIPSLITAGLAVNAETL